MIKKPSVSKILEIIFWEVFEELPPFILQKAIDKGNCIHFRAEEYIKNSNALSCICKKPVKSHNVLFQNLINDLDNLDFTTLIKSEKMHETEDLKGIIDLQIINENQIILVDFKTNSKVDLVKWKYQLTMYAYLHNQSWDIDWNKYQIQVWHYNVNHKKTIHILDLPTEKEIKEIKNTIELYWKEQNDK